jgi:hypothetical protein
MCSGLYLKERLVSCVQVLQRDLNGTLQEAFSAITGYIKTCKRDARKSAPPNCQYACLFAVEHRKYLLIEDRPYFLAMPVWDQPGMLRGLQPNADFDGLSAHLYYHIPKNIQDTLELTDGEIAEIRPEFIGFLCKAAADGERKGSR